MNIRLESVNQIMVRIQELQQRFRVPLPAPDFRDIFLQKQEQLKAGGYRDIIEKHAGANRLDPDLVRAVVKAESDFNWNAVSKKGAMGLMQLMPETANSLGVENPFDADQNVKGGTRYLKELLGRFNGSTEKALAAYNAGPDAVEKHNGIPPYKETRDYLTRVLREYGRLKRQ